MIRRLLKVAKSFKPNKFNIALIDYLADELKLHNIKCRKKDAYVKIKLNKPIDKYESLIIDCFNGKIYLRDNDNNDKKVLNLNRFYGNRESDAMYCAKGCTKQILKFLEKHNQNELTIEAKYVDKRNKFIDKRNKIARTDWNNRDDKDGAIVYIDGGIYVASTHARAIHNYLTQNGSEGLFDPSNRPVGYDPDLKDRYTPTRSDEMDMEEIENNISQLAFAHKVTDDMVIYLETDTLQNVDANTVANAIKTQFPDYDVYIDETQEKIANMIIHKSNRLKKVIALNDRDFAIAIINGEVFDGDTHGEAITKYLKSIGIDDISVYDRDELEMIMGHGFKNQFAAAHAKDNSIYIEPTTLENISLNDAVNLIHTKYPQYNIYDVDSNEKLANVIRLKKNAGDPLSRKFAITYIDGKIYEGDTHAECINKYLKDNNLPIKKENVYFRFDIDENINTNEHSLGFAYMSNNDNIYIYKDQLINLSLDTFINELKNNYNNNIYDEESDEKLANINKLKIARTDIQDRDDNGAIVYINGEIYEANTHAQAINNYLKDHYKDLELNEKWYRPITDPEKINDDLHYSLIDDFETLEKSVESLAFAHKDSTNYNGYNNNKTIYLETDTLQNVDANTVINKLKEVYPDYVVIDDVNGEKIAKVSRLKKNAWHDIADRDKAIVYIDGNIIEGYTHGAAINQYLKDRANIQLNETQIRPNIEIEPDDAWDKEQEEDLNNIYNNINQIAFAHKNIHDKEIYLEPEGYNITDINEIGKALKQQYPEYDILLDNASNFDYKKIANVLKENAYHDINNRTSAILYIEGNVLEGLDHYDMINEYLKEHYDLDRDDPKQEKEANKLFDSLPYAMGSKVDEDNAIYMDSITVTNVDENTVINAIKSKYPEYKIKFEEETYEDVNEYVQNATGYTLDELNQQFKMQANKFNRLKKTSRHDINSRDSAIVYVNGEVFEGHTHAEAINQYLNSDVAKQYRYEVYNNVSDDEQLAFAHKIDSQNAIFLELWTLKNVDPNTVLNKLKETYPDYKIYSDSDDDGLLSEKDDDLDQYIDITNTDFSAEKQSTEYNLDSVDDDIDLDIDSFNDIDFDYDDDTLKLDEY